MSIITAKNAVRDDTALYYFKKEIHTRCCRGLLNIYADARYKLRVNGELAAVGPCRRNAATTYYDDVDISAFLKEGENIIEIAVLQLPAGHENGDANLLESVIRSGELRLCVWGSIDGEKIETDESWSVAREHGVEFFNEPYYEFFDVAGLYERVSAEYRRGLVWESAVCNGDVYRMDDPMRNSGEIVVPVKKRTIPMMCFEQKCFSDINGSVYDAGALTCGYVRARMKGHGKVKLVYAECRVFYENGRIKKRKRDDENGVIMGDCDILEVNGELCFETFWMRTFRYIQVETDGNVEIESMDYMRTGYPIKVSDKYDFGNERDNKLFEISVNALKCCMHETYVDCPYYEQIQYTMDTYLQMMFTYQLTTDCRLAEKAIDDFASSYTVGGLTQSRHPGNKYQYIPGFSLFFIFMLYEHMRRFSDAAFVRRYINIADGIVTWFAERLDGYMVNESNLWDFIDWVPVCNLMPKHEKEPITVYSLMLACAAQNMSELHAFLGNTVPGYSELAKNIKNDVKKRCFDTERGVYAGTPSKLRYSMHAQIWAVLCGLEKDEAARTLLRRGLELAHPTCAYMFTELRAFETAGMYEAADCVLDELRVITELGCTTTPEWIGEDVRSECHAWSAVAIYEFTAKVLGVTYRDNEIRIAPYTGGRQYARGEVATPRGMVSCGWEKRGGELSVEIKLPEGEQARLTMPDGNEFTVTGGIFKCAL